MKYVLVLVALVAAFKVHAKEIFPKGCVPQRVTEEHVNLVAEKPALVMIHNLSNMNIWITHPEAKDPGVSAGWTSLVEAGNWSALALAKGPFELGCIESKPGHEQQVACSEVLAICQWSDVTMPKDATGTFWAGENLTLSALTAHVGSRGVVVPTSAQ